MLQNFGVKFYFLKRILFKILFKSIDVMLEDRKCVAAVPGWLISGFFRYPFKYPQFLRTVAPDLGLNPAINRHTLGSWSVLAQPLSHFVTCDI